MCNKKKDFPFPLLLTVRLKLMWLRYIREQGEGRSSALPDLKMLGTPRTSPAKEAPLSLDRWRGVFNYLPAPHV